MRRIFRKGRAGEDLRRSLRLRSKETKSERLFRTFNSSSDMRFTRYILHATSAESMPNKIIFINIFSLPVALSEDANEEGYWGSSSSSLATPKDEGDWMPRQVPEHVPCVPSAEVIAHNNGASGAAGFVDIILADEPYSAPHHP